MFFALSKSIGLLALPSNFALLLGICGAVLLFTRFASAGRPMVVASFLIFLVLGASPIGNLLIYALEQRFPPWDPTHGAPDGVIVLGGAIDADISTGRRETALTDAAERMTVVAKLARQYPSARIVYSGGNSSFLHPGASESDYAMPLFESFGIARDRIILQGRSRNTAEDAAFSKDIIKPKRGERWLIITSAYHMPRAIGVFRQAGFPVEAYPVDWRTADLAHAVSSFNNLSEGLIKADRAMREWAGLLAYWLTGRSSELFPGPT